MRSQSNVGRIYLFDNLKFFLILTVVVGHFIETATVSSHLYKAVFVFIYAFHMPVFLFCSGLFHSNKDVYVKAFKYISVGFATKIFLTVSGLFLRGQANFSLLKDSGLPWYMFVLAIYTVSTYLLRNIDKRYLLVFSVVLALFVGYDESIGDYLYISRAIVFYPFYLCGQLVTKDNILKINRSKTLKAVGAVIISAWFVLCFMKADQVTVLRVLFTGRNSFAVNDIFENWGFLYRTLCYVITLFLSVSVIALVPDCKLPVITEFGSRTIQVYIWHGPVLILLKRLGIGAMLMSSAEGKVLWLFFGVVLTFILSLKPFSFPSKQIFKYCRRQPEEDKNISSVPQNK